jgi:hypothetical protein
MNILFGKIGVIRVTSKSVLMNKFPKKSIEKFHRGPGLQKLLPPLREKNGSPGQPGPR